MILETVQRYLPEKLKQKLKPHFRLFFPNKLMAVWWITFRCSYACGYCPYCGKNSTFHKNFPKTCEKSGKEWLDALAGMPPTSFYISGGEPFLFDDLPDIINDLPEKHAILGVVTNAFAPVDAYKRVRKKIHLNVSFHREFAAQDAFVKKVLALKDDFHLTVNIVATEENFDFIKNKIAVFAENGINVHIDPLVESANKPHEYGEEYKRVLRPWIEKERRLDAGKMLNAAKLCSAGRNYYNLLPNGDAMACARAMDHKYSPFVEKDENPVMTLGNVFDGTFRLNEKDLTCGYDCICHCDWDYARIRSIKRPKR